MLLVAVFLEPSLKQERASASSSVVFYRKKEKALVIKARELRINNIRAPKLGTEHFPLPASPNNTCAIYD